MHDTPRFYAAGDHALVVEIGESIDPETNDHVRGLMLAIERMREACILDIVPSYRSLLIVYDPILIDYDRLIELIRKAEFGLLSTSVSEPRILTIPTLYGGQHGPDIDYVASHAGLTVEDVTELHSSVTYRVYMIGFSPGFPYLGGLPEKLSTPRLQTPRIRIPAGAVGIAESQTGVYPSQSPGGWRLIGQTPIPLFQPDRDPPSLVVAGDFIKFSALESKTAYEDLSSDVTEGRYQPEIMYMGDSPSACRRH